MRDAEGLPRLRFAALFAVLALMGFGESRAQGAEPSDEPAQPLLRFMTEERPTNNFTDPATGRLIGANADKLREMASRLGVRVEFVVAKWSRSYGLARSVPGHCAFSMVKTPEREPQFLWVGPIGDTNLALVARRADDVKIEKLEDARPYSIGVYTQDVREQMLRSLGGFQIDAAAADTLNAKKLAAGRIDLWFTDMETYLAAPPGLRRGFEVVLRLKGLPLFLGCHRTTPERWIGAMNRALTAMREEGVTAEIEARYENWPG